MEENGCEGNGALGVFVGFVADVYEEGHEVKGPARRVKGRNTRRGDGRRREWESIRRKERLTREKDQKLEDIFKNGIYGYRQNALKFS